MRILSMKDRLDLKIGEVTMKLKPLNVLEQREVMASRKNNAGEIEKDLLLEAFAYIKFALKDLKGVKTYSGGEYKLEFDDAGYLTDDCVSEVFTMSSGAKLLHLIQYLKNNEVREKYTYFGSENEIEGVELKVMAHQE